MLRYVPELCIFVHMSKDSALSGILYFKLLLSRYCTVVEQRVLHFVMLNELHEVMNV